MSDSPGTTGSSAANPYAPTAVASITDEDQAPVTVPTEAVRRATGYLDTYLDAYLDVASGTDDAAPTATRAPSPGNVIAIVGDYGTGKTHLANHLMLHLRERTPENGHALYLEASRSGTFLSIYKEFMRILQESHELVVRVREYYTDVVADWLQASTLFGPQIAEGLRVGETTTRHLAQTFGLTEASHLQELQGRLRHITNNENISKALALLARDGFEDDVLAWLRGGPPAASLQERHITQRIDSDAAALEAMGVFALLYGHRNHRFLLIIDEIEKLLLTASRSPDGLAGLKKLLEVFAAARGFLVIVGLPDMVQQIGMPTFQRLGYVVRMPPMDTKDVEQLVRVSHARALGRETLDPFTEDGLSYLTQLTAGVPRQVIRLLHRCYAEAASTGHAVTPDVIRESASGFAFFTRDHVIASIRHLATREGLHPELDRRLIPGDMVRADVWIPLPSSDETGVAFTITDCVLTTVEADRLTAVARRIRTSKPDAVLRLVVASWVAPEVENQLATAFGSPTLVYQPDASFDQAVLTVIRTLTGGAELQGQRLEAHGPGHGSDLTAVEDELEQLRWQQDDTRAILEQLAGAVDRLRSTSEHRVEALHGRIVGLRADLAAVHDLPAAAALPAQVQAYFDAAEEALNEVFRLRTTLTSAFELTTQGAALPTAFASNLVSEGRAMLSGANTAETIGVLAAVAALVEAFREAVLSWHERFDAPGSPGADADDALRSICGTYDDLFEPLERRLGGWERLAGWWEAPTGRVVRSASGDNPALQQGQDLRSLLSGLGVAVQRSAGRAR